jgi:hypothetical protein
MPHIEDDKILYAMQCLLDHLLNHPNREGNSVAYRIEQAITLLREAKALAIIEDSNGY